MSGILRKTILIATIFSIFVIALGAYTRLVHAGLGCPDWPLCYGHAWAPLTSNDITIANLNFPEIPVNLTKTWPEMTHRFLASTLGLLCIFIVYMGIKIRQQSINFPIKHSIFLLAFIIVQGLFGMWTVTLKLWPQVVTLHLLGGFTTFSLLILLYLKSCLALGSKSVFLAKFDVGGVGNSLLNKVAMASLIIIGIQVGLGGWVTSNYAALACLELPLCDASNVNANDIMEGFNIFQVIGPNYLGGLLDGNARIAIHNGHRLGALIASTVLFFLIVMLLKQSFFKLSIILSVILTIQLTLGFSNVYFHLPLFNAVAHNVVGALLIGFLVVINWRIRLFK